MMTAPKLATILLSLLCASAAAAKTIPVVLGKEFRLEKGQVARIGKSQAFLRITKFINSPCPKGAQCIWSGLAVMTELTVDGKIVPPGAKDFPYDITGKDSDYTTYANFVVDEPEAACSRPGAGHQGECLRNLARRRSDFTLCRKIKDDRTRGFCLEDLAEELKKDELCREVVSPTQHCLYVKSKATGNLAACDDIVTRGARVRCFKELSTEGGGGPRSCSQLAPDVAKRCLEDARGPSN